MSYTNKYYQYKNTLLASRYFVAVCFSVLFMLLANLLISVDTFALQLVLVWTIALFRLTLQVLML